MATSGSDARYAHLLEPIRDLAQNWAIDIASELEEYLSELEAITISFDDGRTLNFAEAALVIQGSACIYSKKVEHLYTLVYQVLNQVVENKRTAKQSSSLEADGRDADTAGFDDEDEPFLTLDDTIKEVDNISLPMRGATRNAISFTLTRPPLAVVPQGAGAGSGEESECKMHACVMHESGALLLPHMQLSDRALAAMASPGAPTIPVNSSGGGWQLSSETAAMDAGDDDDDGDCAAPMDDDDDWHEPLLDAIPVEAGGGTDWVSVAQSPAAGTRAGADAGADRDAEDERARAAEATQPQRPGGSNTGWDPWAPLDPHDSSGNVRRPFRKGKTYSAAEASALAARVERNAFATEADALEAEKENDSTLAAGRGTCGVPKGDLLRWLQLLPSNVLPGVVPLRQPLWEQFEGLHTAECKRRAALRRQLRLQAAQREHVSSAADAEATEVEAGAFQVDGEPGGAAGGSDAEEAYDQDDGYFEVAPMGFEPDDDDDDDYGGVAEEDGSGVNAGGVAAPLSYEEMCREHLESFLQAGSNYREDLELLTRVEEWKARVEPALREEECRPPFDIKMYGARILKNFERVERPVGLLKHRKVEDKGGSSTQCGSVMPFAQLTQCEESYEVCRMFLAALQLTNQGNVGIVTEGSVEDGSLQVSLQLLSTQASFDVDAFAS